MMKGTKKLEGKDRDEYNPSLVFIVLLITVDFVSIMGIENQIFFGAYDTWLFYIGIVTGSIATLMILLLSVTNKMTFAYGA